MMLGRMPACLRALLWTFCLALSVWLLAGFPREALAATTIPGGNVTGTWSPAGSPYIIQGDVIVPVGGGGLIGGVGVAVKSTRPDVQVIGVQAAALPAMSRSLEARRRVRVDAAPTIADGIAVRQVGALTFELAQAWVDRVVTVDEEELANAVLLLLEIEKTVVEGAGAASLAGAIKLRDHLRGKKVVGILSGGNLPLARFASLLA